MEWEPVAGSLVEAGLALPGRWEQEYRPRAHEITAFWTDVADLAAYEAVNLDSDRWADL